MVHFNNYKIQKNDSGTLPISNVLRFLSVDMYINTFQAYWTIPVSYSELNQREMKENIFPTSLNQTTANLKTKSGYPHINVIDSLFKLLMNNAK